MFDDITIVQSAINAFNNSALVAPAFLWWALLAVPLFVLVYYYGGAFLEKIGWTRAHMVQNAGITTVIMTVLWMILFGGNYGALRDYLSVLPYVTAVILFMCALYIATHTRNIQIPRWRDMSKRMRQGAVLGVALVLCAVGLTDTHVWWGPILQIAAVVFGVFVGRTSKFSVSPFSGTIVIMMSVMVAVLMQPEFFRFGQLGNLTLLHKVSLVIFGILAVGALALRWVHPANRIHQSAFIKLKWMARFVTLLLLALFLLTESVPVFLGLCGAVAILFAMSVWHARLIPATLDLRFWACTLIAFGVLTSMPVISAMGLVCYTNLPRDDFWAQSRFLL